MTVIIDNPLVGKVIMTCLAGSKAYGTSLPTSDTDIRGIFVAPPKSIRTPWHTINEYTLPNEEDGKVYELNNFMKLFLDMNPNIIELMFVRESEILSSTPEYWELRKYAHQLLNSNIAFRFSGYAMAQMKRIKGHDKWINNPQPKELPTQREFMKLVHNYLPGNPIQNSVDFHVRLHNMENYTIFLPLGENMYAVIEDTENPGLFSHDNTIRKLEYAKIPDEVKRNKPLMIVRYLDDEHKTAKEKHRQYWEWKTNRNEARSELEQKFGYDTKHAMHLVRLMRMAEEILRDGEVNVFRKDAAELLEIRGGKLTLEELLEWAEKKDELIHKVLYKETSLPKRSDLNLATEVLLRVQDMAWAK